ncbi:hypothetical protein HGM15179_007236 [Zosterops borbonicus]|uniref:Uncharacterized protein n=1 Tax=Zosterops borbonicus TaxID=364589 RepID=A0A8K1GKV0_9PASS|nr:hypothetical protein HGM15179_007236 [Zosterops borbonicus]
MAAQGPPVIKRRPPRRRSRHEEEEPEDELTDLGELGEINEPVENFEFKLSLNSQQYRGRGHKAPNVILCVGFVRPLGTLQKDGPKNGPQGTRENNKDINVSLVI